MHNSLPIKSSFLISKYFFSRRAESNSDLHRGREKARLDFEPRPKRCLFRSASAPASASASAAPKTCATRFNESAQHRTTDQIFNTSNMTTGGRDYTSQTSTSNCQSKKVQLIHQTQFSEAEHSF